MSSRPFTDLSHEEIVATIDRIFYNVSSLFPPSMEPERQGWGLHEEGDLRWLRTDPPSEYPNWIFDARFEASAANERIADIKARIDSGELPGLWVIGPSSRPADLGERLAAHGFTHLATMPGMAADLDNLDPGAVAARPLRLEDPTALDIHRIDEAGEFAEWARVNITGFQEYFHGTGCEAGLYSRLMERDAPPEIAFYGAWLDDRMVGAAQSVRYAGAQPTRVVELHQCSVIPEYRRLGIARRLVTRPLLDAHAEGCRMASLFAEAKAADPFWLSMGFRPFCDFHWYVPGW